MRIAAALICMVVATAQAQTAPIVTPARDVDVTYKVPVAGGQNMAILQRLRFSATLHRQRVDLPTSGNWMVVDYVTHRMTMVRDDSRELVEAQAPDNTAQPGAGAGFARVGPAQVANLACTEWRTRDIRGNETIACYTNDGVLLRARAGQNVLMEAVDVIYHSLDAGVFALPEGYTRQKAQ